MPNHLIRGLYNVKPQHTGAVITIGNFDGIHKGHQALLKKLKQKAQKLKAPSMVIIFEPQPSEFFGNTKSIPARLTRWKEKVLALSSFGIDYILTLPFNTQLAHMTAQDFIQTVLIKTLQVRHILVGDDFKFGKERKGDINLLKQEESFTVESMPTFGIDKERVSSTKVRQALQIGDLETVHQLLGHHYCMQGKVVSGNQLGRQLGFPTANIFLHRKKTPVAGIYVVKTHIDDEILQGVANVGTRPTVFGTKCLLEVYLFDFNQDIYGKQVEVEFLKKLRDEERFDTLELLKEKMLEDATQARAYFETELSQE